MITSSRTLGKAQALILACILALPITMWLNSAAVAQQTSADARATIQTTPKPYVAEVSTYAAKRYSVIGPVSVIAATENTILLFTGDKPYHVSVTGKRLTVKDENAQAVSLGAVERGSTVYVCGNKSEVIVYLLAKAQTGPKQYTVEGGVSEKGVTRGAH